MLPIKAICEMDLTKNSGSVSSSSANAVKKVNFVKNSKLTGLGFLKNCTPTGSYCTLHAKYVVGLSVLYRSSLGSQAAEERLVYDVTDKLVGTVSIAIPNFVPMQNISESQSKDSETNSLANPQAHTLISKDIASKLVASWRHIDDDIHPGNISTEGRIDFDMSWYNHIAHIIKGPRISVGNLQHHPAFGTRLKEEDLHFFPLLRSSRTHWPSHSYPENYNPFKKYSAQSSFVELSTCDKFREQMFAALLKELLSFQTGPLQARLNSQLGDETIDLDSLASDSDPTNQRKEDLIDLLDEELFYTRDDENVLHEKSFVEHFLGVAQKEYDDFYKVVVNYNQFNKYICDHPEAYLEAREFFIQENKKYLPEEQYDLNEMDRMFQKIWRDSSVFKVLKLLGETEKLFDKLQKDINTSLFFSISTTVANKVSSQPLYRRGIPEKMQPIESDAIPQKIKNIIGDLYSKLYSTSLVYFNRQEASIENNTQYIQQCTAHINDIQRQLTDIYSSDIPKFAKQCGQTNQLLSTWLKRLNELSYPSHVEVAQKRKSPITRYESARNRTPHTNKHIILSHNIDSILANSLSTWLNKQRRNDIIIDIYISLKNYKPKWSLTGALGLGRADTVRNRVNIARRNPEISSEELLASIISTDRGGWENNSLNTIIMTRLIDRMLPDITSNIETCQNYCALSDFKTLYSDQSFDLHPYILKIKDKLDLTKATTSAATATFSL